MNCPLRNFEECPEHNKKGGCAWWMSYANNRDTQTASLEGCASVLTPMLLLETSNNLGVVAGEINKVGSEVSALRDENIKENEANRMQLFNFAKDDRTLVRSQNELVKAGYDVKGISA